MKNCYCSHELPVSTCVGRLRDVLRAVQREQLAGAKLVIVRRLSRLCRFLRLLADGRLCILLRLKQVDEREPVLQPDRYKRKCLPHMTMTIGGGEHATWQCLL